ncbi:MAG: hypothetical protein V4640_02920 [Verrucomicrobiota bacterium]
MKRQIILSLDHEIFGNGTGDVRQHMTKPAEQMARACEKYGMPLTVFFEVEEYMAFGRERGRLIAALGYDPEMEVRAQAVDFAKRGHDLQLHVHPEWVGATFDGAAWQLRSDKRTVDSLFGTVEETTEYIRTRKAVVDGIWAEAGDARRVTAFRAGAFCAQPGEKLLPALAANEIFVDSSLVKGMTRDDEHVHLDFRKAPAMRRYWQVSQDVACEDDAGKVLEIPIYSRMGRRIQQLTPRRLMAKFSGNVPVEKQREMVGQLGMGRSPVSVARFLAKPFPIKLDFHNMSARQMLRWILNAPPAPDGDMDVIMLIGHSKEHRDHANFETFLAGVAANPALEVISLNDFSTQLKMRASNLLSPCSSI